MSKRIHFSAWGKRADELDLPAYAMRRDDGYGDDIEAVCRAIERTTRLDVVTCRPDGTSLSKGKSDARHYQMTLGRPCPGGGWTPEAEIWVAIPYQTEV